MRGKRCRIMIIVRSALENALALKLGRSEDVEIVIVVPGNGGTGTGVPSTVVRIDSIDENDTLRILKLAQHWAIHLVVPGPEQLIARAFELVFRGAGFRCFAPKIDAVRIGASRVFSKDFMARHDIPTAASTSFPRISKAKKYIVAKHPSYRMVIKATGLTGGRGVVMPETVAEACEALGDMMLDDRLQDVSCREVVIEERLEGEELSILTFSAGTTFKSLPAAQIQKRLRDGDKGPLTGGMGCYAPVKAATRSVMEEIERLVIKPTIDGLRRENTPLVGVLRTKIILTDSSPKYLGYKVEFGEIEAATLLPLLESSLVTIMFCCIDGRLHQSDFVVKDKFCATVVMSSGGYPGLYRMQDSLTLIIPSAGRHEPIRHCTSTQELLETHKVEKHVSFLHAGTRRSRQSLDCDGRDGLA